MPQVVRSEWLNLNGQWEFAETDDPAENKYLSDQPYPDRIMVPFCRESKLSGLGRTEYVKNVWYRRTFVIPADWKSSRILLHIGASDWLTRVWVNGQLLGEHKGGSAPIVLEATKYLNPGKNTVIIHAFDDARSGIQPLGKQSTRESYGCLYTRTTGIWQTVWLEGVGGTYIKDFHIEPDPDHSRVLIQAEVNGPDQGLKVKAVAYINGKVVGTAEAPADWRNSKLVLNLSKKHLWSVDDPFLYDLKLTLQRGSSIIDNVASYFGLRSVSIQGAAILINGKPVFQRLILDQGFFPDGIWTAPSDGELRADIERSKAAGFNGARYHQKVFDPRSFYWADKLGYLVWGEFPNWGMSYTSGDAVMPMIREWVEVVRRDRNHPSIVGWCPFNETGGSAAELQNTVAAVTRALDPSRPLIDTSGYTHSLPDAEILDAHDYDQIPASFRARWNDSFSTSTGVPLRYGSSPRSAVPFMVSEFGGIGWTTTGGWGYGTAPADMDAFYARYKGLVDALLDSKFMFGFCYTQLTDVEQERNGLYTYDRKPKFDVKKLHDITSRQAACEKDPPVSVTDKTIDWRVVFGAAPDGNLAHEWRYTFDSPTDTKWTAADFNDSTWQKGYGGFGDKGGWEWAIHTPWKTENVWLRQEFNYNGSSFTKAMLVIHYDNETEVYLNGSRIWAADGWNDQYMGFDVTKPVQAVLKPGRNVVAIHCHQDAGGQFIDAALLVGTTR